VQPDWPLVDAPTYLAYLAGFLRRIRLGTSVYLLGLRHPFVTARGFATADLVSNGRIELGVGAGWLEAEWRACGLEFRDRGKRLDEAIQVVRRLWSDPTIEFHGRYFDFEEVGFEPKPVQPGGPPILIGGNSDAALRRAARLGDGWISEPLDLPGASERIRRLSELSAGAERDVTITVCTGDVEDPAEIEEWRGLGVDRLIVRPWTRSNEALDAIKRFAARHL
jgi:probable F420-dependent oxidoreductase